MRLLFLNHNLREHGTYFRAFHLARELVRLGHAVTLWTASPDHWYRAIETGADGVRIVETPSWNPVIYRDDGWGPVDLAWRGARILREPFDLVYGFAHPPNVYFPAWIARRLLRKPLVIDWCDSYRDGIFPLRRAMRRYRGEHGIRMHLQETTEWIEQGMERRILHLADGVTVISKALESEALSEGIAPCKILRFPSGANLSEIRVLDRQVCRQQLQIATDGSPLLGYIANYNPDERFLIAALRIVFQRHPSARLISTAPPFTSAFVDEAGIGRNILSLGRRPFAELEQILGACDLLLLPLDDNPSNCARWPHKFGDYLASGRPLVSNLVGDIGEYFGPQNSSEAIGILSAPDAEEYGNAIAKLLDQPKLWPIMGAAARRLAETALYWPTITKKVESFLLRYKKP